VSVDRLPLQLSFGIAIQKTLFLSAEHLRRKMLDRFSSWQLSMLFPASNLSSIRPPFREFVYPHCFTRCCSIQSTLYLQRSASASKSQNLRKRPYQHYDLPRASTMRPRDCPHAQVARMAIDRRISKSLPSILQYQLVPIIYFIRIVQPNL
jgi:hypothetical protein